MQKTDSFFEQLARSRRATRQFLPTPLSAEQITTILSDAQQAPSNCNTQPWHVHIVSGDSKQRLSAQLLHAAEEAGDQTPDFSFDTKAFEGVYAERYHGMARIRNDAAGIAREDAHARRQDMLRNLEFYGAPHAAFLFMPDVGDNVRTAGDIGMYAQTFLLSLAAHGLAGIPQTVLGFYPDTTRAFLKVPAEYKLLFGISFGYPDLDAPSQMIDVGRVPLTDSVVFHN